MSLLWRQLRCLKVIDEKSKMRQFFHCNGMSLPCWCQIATEWPGRGRGGEEGQEWGPESLVVDLSTPSEQGCWYIRKIGNSKITSLHLSQGFDRLIRTAFIYFCFQINSSKKYDIRKPCQRWRTWERVFVVLVVTSPASGGQARSPPPPHPARAGEERLANKSGDNSDNNLNTWHGQAKNKLRLIRLQLGCGLMQK